MPATRMNGKDTRTRTMAGMDFQIAELLSWLQRNKKGSPYMLIKPEQSRSYIRIFSGPTGIYCFIPKCDLENKLVGKVKKGDILAAIGWGTPDRYARGSLFDKSTWDFAFGDYGVNSLNQIERLKKKGKK